MYPKIQRMRHKDKTRCGLCRSVVLHAADDIYITLHSKTSRWSKQITVRTTIARRTTTNKLQNNVRINKYVLDKKLQLVILVFLSAVFAINTVRFIFKSDNTGNS